MTPSRAFAECVEKCGESVYPPDWTPSTFNSDLEEPTAQVLKAGIVHLLAWLNAKEYEVVICPDVGASQALVAIQRPCIRGWVDTQHHDSTPASIFIALCRLAERCGK